MNNADPTEEEVRRHKEYHHRISNALSQALDLSLKHDKKTMQMITVYKDKLAAILEEQKAQQERLDENLEKTIEDNIRTHAPVPSNDDYFKESFPIRALRNRSEAVSAYANNKKKYNEKKEVCPAVIFNAIQASCRDSQASVRAVAKLGLMSQTVLSNVAAQAERSAYSSIAMRYVVENSASMDFCIDALKVATGPDSGIQKALNNLDQRIKNIIVPPVDDKLVMTAIAENTALNEFIEKKIEEKATNLAADLPKRTEIDESLALVERELYETKMAMQAAFEQQNYCRKVLEFIGLDGNKMDLTPKNATLRDEISDMIKGVIEDHDRSNYSHKYEVKQVRAWRNGYLQTNPITGNEEILNKIDVIFTCSSDAERFLDFARQETNRNRYSWLKGVRQKLTKEQKQCRTFQEVQRDIKNKHAWDLWTDSQDFRTGEDMPNQWVIRREKELVWIKTDNIRAHEKFSPEKLKKTIQKIENLTSIKPKDTLALPKLVLSQQKYNEEKVVAPSQTLKDVASRWKREYRWS